MPNRMMTLNAYTPLARDGRFLYTLDDAWNISVVRSAMGGPTELRFHLRGKDYVDEWLAEGIGRHIEAYSPDLGWMWDGFVDLIEAHVGTIYIQRGPLLNMGNKVCVEYSTIDWSGGEPVYGVRNFTDWAEDTDSQAKYGILEKVVSTAGANEDRGEQIRDLSLQDIKEPEMTEAINPELSSIASVTMHCKGYWHWLDTYTFNDTTTGDTTVSAKVEDVLAGEPNGIFSTDYSYLDTNSTAVGAYENDNRTAATIIKATVALGDSSLNRWIFRFGEGRVPYLQTIPDEPLYERSVLDPNLAIYRYGQGFEESPWNIQAGQWIFHADLLESLYGEDPADDLYSDPRYFFIEETDFLPPYSVRIQGERNTRLKQLINQFGVGGFRA